MALFRGIAEGLTEGAVDIRKFPMRSRPRPLSVPPGPAPAFAPIFTQPVVARLRRALHRSIIGRAALSYTFGFNADAARYAGLPVARRLTLVYVLSGSKVASVAAVIYTCCIRGGCRPFGRRHRLRAQRIRGGAAQRASVAGADAGRSHGTLIGLFILAVLQNGLQLAALPSELAGVLTGAVLIGVIVVDRLRARPQTTVVVHAEEEVPVKNAQVAVLCGAVLAGSLIVAGTNVWLVRSLPLGTQTDLRGPTAGTPAQLVITDPKAKGPYFVSARKGAEDATELGVDLIWDGPTSLGTQSRMIVEVGLRPVDAIVASSESRASPGRGGRGIKHHRTPMPSPRPRLFINRLRRGIGHGAERAAAHAWSAAVTSALSAPIRMRGSRSSGSGSPNSTLISGSSPCVRVTMTGTRRLPKHRRFSARIRR